MDTFPGRNSCILMMTFPVRAADRMAFFEVGTPCRNRSSLLNVLPGWAWPGLVAYDDQGAMFAARLWWLARWLGMKRVLVLDGGLAAWTAAGHPLSNGLTSLAAVVPWQATPSAAEVCTAEELEMMLDAGQGVLFDARAPDRFRGENETLDAVGGHIPGARNAFFRENLTSGGCFLPAGVLAARWQPLLAGAAAETAVHQCGSGVTACHNLLALEIAGMKPGRLYPGSWSEWCADPARPVARGRT